MNCYHLENHLFHDIVIANCAATYSELPKGSQTDIRAILSLFDSL